MKQKIRDILWDNSDIIPYFGAVFFYEEHERVAELILKLIEDERSSNNNREA